MKKFISILLSILLSNLVLFAQETPSFIAESLDNYVHRGMEQWQIPGVAVLIVKDGKIIIAKGFGVKELGKNDRFDKTLYL